MEMCKAREQCFFIDACRQISEKLIAHVAAGSFGDSIIDSSARLSQFGMRYAPVYYSTATGQGSYGRQGKASVFADALVKAMDGAGSDNFEGESRIYTNSLNRGIEFLIKYVMDDAINLLQRVQIDGLDGFPIHYLDAKPIIPVTVHCEPKEANKEARLSYSNQDGSSKGSRPSPEESDWDVDLEPGSYRFSATFTEGKYRDSYTDDYVNPPGHKIPIKVKE